MNNSSAQETYSITLDDIGTITSSDTITLTGINCYTSGSTFTYASGYPGSPSVHTINCIPNITISNMGTTVWGSQEWVNGFPDWDRVENMCKEFPGLQIAFEKFKTTYKLVKDEYDNPTSKR